MKGQIIIIDLLFFALTVILVIFLIINNLFEIKIDDKETKQNIKELEQILFAEKLVTDCNFLAYTPNNRKGLCYKNVLEIKLNSKIIKQLETENVCRIKIGNGVVYNINTNTKIKTTITRGVIENGAFKIAEISFC